MPTFELLSAFALDGEVPATPYHLRSFEQAITAAASTTLHAVAPGRVPAIAQSLTQIVEGLNRDHPAEQFSVHIVSVERPCFEINGRSAFCLYGKEGIILPEPLVPLITDADIALLMSFGLLIRDDLFCAFTKRLSVSDLGECLESSVAMNRRSPSYGVSQHQMDSLLRDFECGTPLEDIVGRADISPTVSRRVADGLVQLIARKRLSSIAPLADLDSKLAGIAGVLSASSRPVKIDMVSFGSPWHHALWNILSVEALRGDLIGEFRENVDVKIHRAVLEDECAAIVHDLAQRQPDIIGLSIELGTLSAVDIFMEKLDLVEFEKPPILVLGNQVPTYFPEKFLADPRFKDALVCLHEGELVMRNLVRIVRHGGSFRDIPNIVFHDHAAAKTMRTRLQNLDMASLPHPPSLDTCHPGITNMIQTSRGCIFGCTYCTRWSSWNASAKVEADGEVVEPNASTKWRPFVLERVLENIEQFVCYGITELEICDDEFFGGVTPRALERVALFCDIIEGIQRKYDISLTYRIFTTPLIISRARQDEKALRTNATILAMLQRLVGNGLVRVYIGLESGDKNQKERYDRRESTEDTIMALQTLRALGVDIDIGFIMFDPYLTTSELLNNVAFFRDNGLVKNNTWPFRPLVVNEGTVMKRQLEKDGLLTGENDPAFLSYGYRFLNADIGIIADAVQSVARESAPVFYTLKTISKAHWERVEGSASYFAQDTVEENALIYLDFMERLGRKGDALFDKGEVEREIVRVRRKILKLINAVSIAFNNGLFDSLEKDKRVLARHVMSFRQISGHLYEATGADIVDLKGHYAEETASDEELAMALNDL